MTDLPQLVQIVYWLALSTWFGGVLFIALAAPVIFRTVKDSNPRLPRVSSANLDGQHGTLLAGSIVGNLLVLLGRMQLFCAAVLLVALLAQWLNADLSSISRRVLIIVRSALYVAAVVLVIYDRTVVAPRTWRYRQEYVDHADEPDIANPAKEMFDRYHKESVSIMGLVLAMLLGMILFSGRMTFVTVPHMAGG